MFLKTSFTVLYAGLVSARGGLDSAPSECGANDSFVHLGCYADSDNGAHAGFTFQLSPETSSPDYYPFGDGITPEVCQAGCRAHGFRLAGLYNQGSCYCATELPNPGPQPDTSEGPASAPGSHPGTKANQSVCQVSGKTCTGDSSQYCGSSTAIDVYIDPTVGTSDEDRSVENYGYVGCFSGEAPGPFFAFLETTSTASCASYCGALGYAYAGRNGIDEETDDATNTGFRTCGCGTEIRSGIQVSDDHCNYFCDGSLNA
jgi:hypothetical protein